MSDLVTVVEGGYRWRVLAECRDLLFDGQGLRLDEWLRSGRARVVKHGPHRTVYHLSLAGLDCYLKHFRLPDTRAWLREWVRPSKARMEYERASAVAARRIPTAAPIALGERSDGLAPGESFLVMRGLRGTESLNQFVETTFASLPAARRARVRQGLASESGKIVARMHDAGMIHHDLHAGNLLVRLGESDQVELYLIDLHSLRRHRALNWRACRGNLIMLNRWAVLRTSRSDRLRFWRAYAAARQGGAWQELGRTPADIARDLETGTWLSNLCFWRHRDRRCLRTNRYYQRVRAAGLAGYAVRDLDPPLLRALANDPDAAFHRPGVVLLKDSKSSTVAEFDWSVAGGPRRVVLKRFRVRTRTEPFASLFRTTAALRSWIFGHGLRERGLPTARPLAVLHRRRWGMACEGYLLTEKIPDARELHAFLSELAQVPTGDRARRLRATVDAVARLVFELHRRRISHRDLKAANVLMSRAPCILANFPASPPSRPPTGLRPWLIDLVGLRQHRRLRRPRRVQNLARLNASFHGLAALTRTDRLRFLRTYLQWGLTGRGGWKGWWRDVEDATLRKVERNRRSGRALA